MGFKIPYTNIKNKILFILKIISFVFIIFCSIPIWFPIIVWKIGLIASDNFVQYFIDNLVKDND